MRHVFKALLVVALGAAGLGCQNRANVQCETDPNCNLTPGGACIPASTGNHWCAYPDPACSSGYRFADQDVGDGVSGACTGTSDAGIDAPDARPDGDTTLKCRIAFEDGIRGSFLGDGSREVWVANIDGSGFVNISGDSTADDFDISWAPNGLRIAFASNRKGRATGNKTHYDIFVANVDGTGLVNLTENRSTSSIMPVWSPDGTRIAFVQNIGDQEAGPIWVMNADGSGAAPLSTLTLMDFMAWSPASNQIAFDHFEKQGIIIPTIVVATVGDGSTPLQLTSSSGPERSACWNPVSRIAFTSSAGDIVTANADGTNLVNVTMNPSDQNSDPQWLDAGNTIAFQKMITGHSEIWLIPSAGGSARQLTHNSIGHDFLQDTSPHGRIAYNHQTSLDAGQVGVVDIDGTNGHAFNAPGGTNSRRARFSFCQ